LASDEYCTFDTITASAAQFLALSAAGGHFFANNCKSFSVEEFGGFLAGLGHAEWRNDAAEAEATRLRFGPVFGYDIPNRLNDTYA
jgi:hypothetical protein